ncbi:hypothetical protein B0T20DRAFT_474262 [Sordaria brevicollis]|uniref:Uncharacterized protein n=1 Tax=Sordaria brevicollis TaxID=83679 RepID=A0AAE0PLY5_SORBR|nr:hypothetical protein B0T20DRAFT_474262 [Sordaria brevicollis]
MEDCPSQIVSLSGSSFYMVIPIFVADMIANLCWDVRVMFAVNISSGLETRNDEYNPEERIPFDISYESKSRKLSWSSRGM